VPKICKHINCTQPVWSNGYCKNHQYLRVNKPGRDNERKVVKETPLPMLLEIAQKIFNTYIRLRDKDKGCISCGGKVEHAGHFYPQGAYSALRFHEINVNGQDELCNCGKYGNLEEYEKGLIKRYGQKAVDELHSKAFRSKGVYKWARAEVSGVISDCKKKISELQKVNV
jgi:hypothetical protein